MDNVNDERLTSYESLTFKSEFKVKRSGDRLLEHVPHDDIA